MIPLTHRNGVAQYTLEHYDQDFADRHLLHGAIAKFARETPDAIALIDAPTGREYTYREFHERTTSLAMALLELGYQPGEFLATSLPLTIAHIFLEYACFQIGVVHAPLDLRLKAPEVVRSLELIQARGFAFLGKTAVGDFGELGRAVQQHCPFVEEFIQFATPGETIPGAMPAAELLGRGRTLATRSAMRTRHCGKATSGSLRQSAPPMALR